MKVAVYTHQDVTDKPVNRFTYARLTKADGDKCVRKAMSLYGKDCDFVFYHDIGCYPADSIDRPALNELLDEVRKGEIDVLCVFVLSRLSTEIALILEVYKVCKAHGARLITGLDGEKAMTVLDKLLEKEAADDHQKR